MYGTDNLLDDRWHMMTTTFNGNVASVWVDGVLYRTKSTSLNLASTPIFLGGIPDVTQSQRFLFTGQLAEVQVWNVALNDTEIPALFKYRP